MRDYFKKEKLVHFEFPIDGDCLNEYDGAVKNGFLTIAVKVKAPIGSEILINEVKADFDGEFYTSEVAMTGYRNTILAIDSISGVSAKIAVYKLSDCINKYRISMDDNILFLQDLTINKDVYTSMFDNPYLALFKKAHDLYEAKVHFNIYYEFSETDMKVFSGKREYFNLTMMTDKYKDEFKANADWLHMSFHARANCPDKPYLTTSLKRITDDIDLVHKEILRFAGAEVFSDVTTLHWGASNEAGVRALRQSGYKGLNGYFDLDDKGETLVSYFYPVELVKHISNRDFWVDNDENVVCSKVDLVLNMYTPERMLELLDEVKANPHKAGFIELLIHEQYFHSDYTAYITRYSELVLGAAKWAYEHGYTGSFLHDVMFEHGRQ